MPNHLTIVSHSLRATLALGAAMARASDKPLLVLLSGQLGGGKTHLTKGIAHAVSKVPINAVTSPTFTLFQQYGQAPTLTYHLDLYRIEHALDAPEEIIDALEERAAWVCVEWADRHPELMPKRPTLAIEVEHLDADTRRWHLEGEGYLLAAIAEQIKDTEGLNPSAS